MTGVSRLAFARAFGYDCGMPELPEVEIARRSLVRWFDAHRLVRTEAEKKARTFRGGKPADFERLDGALEKAERKGKYLMLTFSNGRGLLAHLGMTGKFVKRRPDVAEPFSRARFMLDSGEVIHFRDPRLFGNLVALPVGELTRHKAVRALGVDPLVDGLTVESLKAALGTTKVDLKVALMDQARVAGLGNIHAAEALFRARLHPARKVSTLSDADQAALVKAIDETIAFALAQQTGEEIEYVEEGADNPFLVYGREDEPCRVCGTRVETAQQGGRTTFFCPSCQPAMKVQRPKSKRRAKGKR